MDREAGGAWVGPAGGGVEDPVTVPGEGQVFCREGQRKDLTRGRKVLRSLSGWLGVEPGKG